MLDEGSSPRDFMVRTDPRAMYSFLKDLIDPMASMIVLKHVLRGEEYNDSEETWNKIIIGKNNDGGPIYARPLLNEMGIQKVMVELSRVSKDTNLSNLTDDEINIILKHFGIVLNDLLYNNMDAMDLGMDDYQNVWLLVYHHVKFSLKRAMGQGERELIKPSIAGGLKEQHDANMPEQRSGLFGMFRRR